MDKKRAIERLDAIEKEAEELRKIIEKGDKIEYDCHKMYVAIYGCYAYLLCGLAESRYFRWHSFEKHITEQGAGYTMACGQEAIDYMTERNADIHVLSDPKVGMKFFFEKYMELNV